MAGREAIRGWQAKQEWLAVGPPNKPAAQTMVDDDRHSLHCWLLQPRSFPPHVCGRGRPTATCACVHQPSCTMDAFAIHVLLATAAAAPGIDSLLQWMMMMATCNFCDLHLIDKKVLDGYMHGGCRMKEHAWRYVNGDAAWHGRVGRRRRGRTAG